MPVLFYLLTAKSPAPRCSLWSWPERSRHRASAQQISVGSWVADRWLPIAAANSEQGHAYAQCFPAADQTALRVWWKGVGPVLVTPLPESAACRTHRLEWSAGTAQPFSQLGMGDAVLFAQGGNAFAQGDGKFTFFASDAHDCRRRDL